METYENLLNSYGNGIPSVPMMSVGSNGGSMVGGSDPNGELAQLQVR